MHAYMMKWFIRAALIKRKIIAEINFFKDKFDLHMSYMANGLILEAAIAFDGRTEVRIVVVGLVDRNAGAGIAGDIPPRGSLQPPSPQNRVQSCNCTERSKRKLQQKTTNN